MKTLRKVLKRRFRITWIEKYEKVFEAETADEAIENRDDKDAFQSCEEVWTQEVRECAKCQGRGRGDRGGSCGVCEDGWIEVKD